ncbi:cytochrome P450 [Collybia nuda]|uniref:Cytochrome P450 n=1 Tax=Collybia nuda TaxID=64659 RepID=A0A9P6CH49_9AGAR|nr:cytochrome P450 [Collybia nuda]
MAFLDFVHSLMSRDFTMSASPNSLLQVIAMGVTTHLYFRKFEPQNPIALIAILVSEPILYIVVQNPTTLNAFDVFYIYTAFLLSVGLSIVLYRLSPFHPLAGFPGPVMNKITQFRSIWIQWEGHQYLINKRLHEKYGAFVRVGPNELSVTDIDIALAILGPGGLPKGRFYEARHDPRAPGNVLVLRGQAHTDRRRIWSRAFTNESLEEYDEPLLKRVQYLIDRLAGAPAPTDLSLVISLFALDFMSDMAFGGGFDMLRDDSDGLEVRSMFDKFGISLSLLCHAPWAVSTLVHLPALSKNILKLRKFAVEWGTNRILRGAVTKDLWYHLYDEAGLEKEKPSTRQVIAEGSLAMVAGSDTTATCLASLFYFLLCYPKCYQRLQAEIDEVFPPGSGVSNMLKHIANLPYLTACINETLRLLPPVPTNGPRQVPYGSGRRIFGGRFIPEGTQVYTPPYSIHRDPRYFSPLTEEFVPERWLPGGISEDQVHNLSAFIPFSHGPANCVGRSLARKEMMAVASAILHKFDIHAADGFDSREWPEGLRDHFVTIRGPLLVNLASRF